MHPGIQPAQVKISVNKTAPHPLSKTASGGKIIHKIALPNPIIFHLSLSFNNFYNFLQIASHASICIIQCLLNGI